MQKGSLFSKSGSWYVRYKDGDKRLSHYLGRDMTREAAMEAKEWFMEEVNKLEGTPITLEEFIAGRYLRDAPVRRSTYVGYLSLFSAYINGQADCRLDLRVYRTKEIQDILNRVARKGLSSRTLQHLKHFLSGVMRYACQVGLREGNPVSEARIPAHLTPPRTVWASELAEIKQHLVAVPYPGKAAIALAAYAGLRRSEIQGLRWLDIGSDALQVTVSVVRGIQSDTKTKASAASVPIIPQLKEILQGYADSLELRHPTDRLFLLSLEKLGQREIQATLAKAGLSWRGWHAYRRGLASNLLELGIDPAVIQRILRHSNLAVTLGHYAKVRGDKAAREALTRLSEKLE